MSNEVRIGSVTARFNEDGTLYLYQPDSNRALSAELAEKLYDFIAEGLAGTHESWLEKARSLAVERSSQLPILDQMTRDSAEYAETVDEFGPARSVVLFDSHENLTPLADVAAEFGVDLTDTERVGTGDSQVPLASDLLTETEREADKNAAESKAPAEPTLKQLRAQAKEAGVSPAGSKAQITARLAKHGH